jgi:hypothetical protein
VSSFTNYNTSISTASFINQNQIPSTFSMSLEHVGFYEIVGVAFSWTFGVLFTGTFGMIYFHFYNGCYMMTADEDPLDSVRRVNKQGRRVVSNL